MRNKRWRRSLAASMLTLALVATACGDDGETDTTTGDTTTDGDTDGTTDAGEEPAAAPGFDGTTIRLGVITPTTGPVAIIGNPLTAGNQVRVDRINAAGGIGGKYKIELVVEDSQYDAPTAVQKYTSLREDVTLFAQLLGTPTVGALTEQLATDNIVAQPASLDAFWVRNPQLIPVGAPYQIQAINGMEWWINEQGNTDSTICWAGHDDPYGEAGLEGMEFAAEQMEFELAATVKFSASDTSGEALAPVVGRLQQAGCEAIFLTTLPTNLGGLLGAAAQGGYNPTWIGQSPTWVNALAQSPLKDYLAATYHVVSDGALWGDTSVPGMAEMLEDVEAHKPDQQPDGYFVFGYAAMMAVEQVLEEAVAQGDLSREGIANAMTSIDVMEFGDLFGDYEWGTAEERDPPRVSRVFAINPDSPETGFFELASDGTVEGEAAKAFTFEG